MRNRVMRSVMAWVSLMGFILLVGSLTPAIAEQEVPPSDRPNTSASSGEVEEVVVLGQILPGSRLGQLFKAFSHYNAGEFADAELLFSNLGLFLQPRAEAATSSIAREVANGNAQIIGAGFQLTRLNIDSFREVSTAVYHALGLSQLQQGKLKKAVASFRKSLRIDKYNSLARADLIYTYSLMGEPKRAGRQLKRLARLQSDCWKKCRDEMLLAPRLARAESQFALLTQAGN